ncbi:unnamed protein product [Pseudo-nitzschia multistriata]|uniref:Uncharacterized protein n=1 Tax=Pseudo-nitzschia multistriata TaxID=183589 RepID=A0A448ZGF2_9STRA|nr:unnamed protein product [Pseudo-nitzschia multistriata]
MTAIAPPPPTTTTNTASAKSNPSPHKRIHHETIIDAPIELAWAALVDVEDWSWNKWTRLELPEGEGPPSPGKTGTLRACYEGDDRSWESFGFEFAAVDDGSGSGKHKGNRRTLAWKGSVGAFGPFCLFRGYHSVSLEEAADGSGRTLLVHKEDFGGLLPALRMGLPYKTLDRNYRLMNESLRDFVEARHRETARAT